MHARRGHVSSAAVCLFLLFLIALGIGPSTGRAQGTNAECDPGKSENSKNTCPGVYDKDGKKTYDANCKEENKQVAGDEQKTGIIGKRCTVDGVSGTCTAIGVCTAPKDKEGNVLDQNKTIDSAKDEKSRLDAISESAKKLLDAARPQIPGTTIDNPLAPREAPTDQPRLEDSVLKQFGYPTNGTNLEALQRISEMGEDYWKQNPTSERPVFSPTGGMNEETIQQLREMSGRAVGTFRPAITDRPAIWEPAIYSSSDTFRDMSAQVEEGTFWDRAMDQARTWVAAPLDSIRQITDGLFVSDGNMRVLTTGIPGRDFSEVVRDIESNMRYLTAADPTAAAVRFSDPEGIEYIRHPDGRVERVTPQGPTDLTTRERDLATQEASARTHKMLAEVERERLDRAREALERELSATEPGGALNPYGDGLTRMCIAGPTDDCVRMMTPSEYRRALEEQRLMLVERRAEEERRLKAIRDGEIFKDKDGKSLTATKVRELYRSSIASRNDAIAGLDRELARLRGVSDEMRLVVPDGESSGRALTLAQYQDQLRQQIAAVGEYDRYLQGHIGRIDTYLGEIAGLQAADLEVAQRHARRLELEPGYAAVHADALARATDDAARARSRLDFLESDWETHAADYQAARERYLRAESIRQSFERGSPLGADAARVEARRLEAEAARLAESVVPGMSEEEQNRIIGRAELARHNAEMYRREVTRIENDFAIAMHQYAIADRFDRLRALEFERSLLPTPTAWQRLVGEEPEVAARRAALTNDIDRLRQEISLNMRPIARLVALNDRANRLAGAMNFGGIFTGQTFTADPEGIAYMESQIRQQAGRIAATEQRFAAIAGGEPLMSYREIDAHAALLASRSAAVAEAQRQLERAQRWFAERGRTMPSLDASGSFFDSNRIRTIDDSLARLARGEITGAMLDPLSNSSVTSGAAAFRDGTLAFQNRAWFDLDYCRAGGGSGICEGAGMLYNGALWLGTSAVAGVSGTAANMSSWLDERLGYTVAGVTYDDKLLNLQRTQTTQLLSLTGQAGLAALDASLIGQGVRGVVGIGRMALAPLTLEGRALTALGAELELRAVAGSSEVLAPRIAAAAADAEAALARAGLTRLESYVVRADGRIVAYIDDAGGTFVPAAAEGVAPRVAGTIGGDAARPAAVAAEDAGRIAPTVVRVDPRSGFYAIPVDDGVIAARGVTDAERRALGAVADEIRTVSALETDLARAVAAQRAAPLDLAAKRVVRTLEANIAAARGSSQIPLQTAGLARTPEGAIVRTAGSTPGVPIARVSSSEGVPSVRQTVPNAAAAQPTRGVSYQPRTFEPAPVSPAARVASPAPGQVITPTQPFRGLVPGTNQGSLAGVSRPSNVTPIARPAAIPAGAPPKPAFTSTPAQATPIASTPKPTVFSNNVTSLAPKAEARGAQVSALSEARLNPVQAATRVGEREAIAAHLSASRQVALRSEIAGLKADLETTRIAATTAREAREAERLAQSVNVIETRLSDANARLAALVAEGGPAARAVDNVIGFAPRPRATVGGGSGIRGPGVLTAPEGGTFAAVRSASPMPSVPSTGPTAMLRGANENPVRTLVQEGNIVRVVEEAAPAVAVPRGATRSLDDLVGNANPRTIPTAANDNMKTLVAANDNAPNDNAPLRTQPVIPPAAANAPPVSILAEGALSPLHPLAGTPLGGESVFDTRPQDFAATSLGVPVLAAPLASPDFAPLAFVHATPLPPVSLAEPRLSSPFNDAASVPPAPIVTQRAVTRSPLPIPGIPGSGPRGASTLPSLPTLGGIASPARPALSTLTAPRIASVAPPPNASGRARPLIPGDAGYVPPVYAPGYAPGVVPPTDDPGGDLKRAYEAEQKRIQDEQRRRFFESQIEWALQRLRTLDPSGAARLTQEYGELSTRETADALFAQLESLLARIQQATLNGGALAGGAGGDAGNGDTKESVTRAEDTELQQARVDAARQRLIAARDALAAPIPESYLTLAAANPTAPIERLVRDRQVAALQRAAGELERLGLAPETSSVRAMLAGAERTRLLSRVTGFTVDTDGRLIALLRSPASSVSAARTAIVSDEFGAAYARVVPQPIVPSQAPRSGIPVRVIAGGVDVIRGYAPEGFHASLASEASCNILTRCIALAPDDDALTALHEIGHAYHLTPALMNELAAMHSLQRSLARRVAEGTLTPGGYSAIIEPTLRRRIALTERLEREAWQSALRLAPTLFADSGLDPLSRSQGTYPTARDRVMSPYNTYRDGFMENPERSSYGTNREASYLTEDVRQRLREYVGTVFDRGAADVSDSVDRAARTISTIPRVPNPDAAFSIQPTDAVLVGASSIRAMPDRTVYASMTRTLEPADPAPRAMTWAERQRMIDRGDPYPEVQIAFFGNAGRDLSTMNEFYREIERLGARFPDETADKLIARAVDEAYADVVAKVGGSPYERGAVIDAGSRVIEAQGQYITPQMREAIASLEQKGLPVQGTGLDLALYVRYGGMVNYGPVAEAMIKFIERYIAENRSSVFSGVRIIPRNPEYTPEPSTLSPATRIFPVSGTEFQVALEVGAVPFHFSHGSPASLTKIPNIVSTGMWDGPASRVALSDIRSNIELEANDDSKNFRQLSLPQILEEVVRVIRLAERNSIAYAAKTERAIVTAPAAGAPGWFSLPGILSRIVPNFEPEGRSAAASGVPSRGTYASYVEAGHTLPPGVTAADVNRDLNLALERAMAKAQELGIDVQLARPGNVQEPRSLSFVGDFPSLATSLSALMNALDRYSQGAVVAAPNGLSRDEHNRLRDALAATDVEAWYAYEGNISRRGLITLVIPSLDSAIRDARDAGHRELALALAEYRGRLLQPPLTLYASFPFSGDIPLRSRLGIIEHNRTIVDEIRSVLTGTLPLDEAAVSVQKYPTDIAVFPRVDIGLMRSRAGGVALQTIAFYIAATTQDERIRALAEHAAETTRQPLRQLPRANPSSVELGLFAASLKPAINDLNIIESLAPGIIAAAQVVTRAIVMGSPSGLGVDSTLAPVQINDIALALAEAFERDGIAIPEELTEAIRLSADAVAISPTGSMRGVDNDIDYRFTDLRLGALSRLREIELLHPDLVARTVAAAERGELASRKPQPGGAGVPDESPRSQRGGVVPQELTDIARELDALGVAEGDIAQQARSFEQRLRALLSDPSLSAGMRTSIESALGRVRDVVNGGDPEALLAAGTDLEIAAARLTTPSGPIELDGPAVPAFLSTPRAAAPIAEAPSFWSRWRDASRQTAGFQTLSPVSPEEYSAAMLNAYQSMTAAKTALGPTGSLMTTAGGILFSYNPETQMYDRYRPIPRGRISAFFDALREPAEQPTAMPDNTDSSPRQGSIRTMLADLVVPDEIRESLESFSGPDPIGALTVVDIASIPNATVLQAGGPIRELVVITDPRTIGADTINALRYAEPPEGLAYYYRGIGESWRVPEDGQYVSADIDDAFDYLARNERPGETPSVIRLTMDPAVVATQHLRNLLDYALGKRESLGSIGVEVPATWFDPAYPPVTAASLSRAVAADIDASLKAGLAPDVRDRVESIRNRLAVIAPQSEREIETPTGTSIIDPEQLAKLQDVLAAASANEASAASGLAATPPEPIRRPTLRYVLVDDLLAQLEPLATIDAALTMLDAAADGELYLTRMVPGASGWVPARFETPEEAARAFVDARAQVAELRSERNGVFMRYRDAAASHTDALRALVAENAAPEAIEAAALEATREIMALSEQYRELTPRLNAYLSAERRARAALEAAALSDTGLGLLWREASLALQEGNELTIRAFDVLTRAERYAYGVRQSGASTAESDALYARAREMLVRVARAPSPGIDAVYRDGLFDAWVDQLANSIASGGASWANRVREAQRSAQLEQQAAEHASYVVPSRQRIAEANAELDAFEAELRGSIGGLDPVTPVEPSVVAINAQALEAIAAIASPMPIPRSWFEALGFDVPRRSTALIPVILRGGALDVATGRRAAAEAIDTYSWGELVLSPEISGLIERPIIDAQFSVVHAIADGIEPVALITEPAALAMLPPPVRFVLSEARAYADALLALLPRTPPPLPESPVSAAVQSPEELVTSRTRLIDRIRALDALSARGPVADVTAPRLIDRIRSSAAAAPAPSAPVPVDASAVPPPLPMDTALDGAYAIQTVILSPDRVSDVRALIGRRDRTVLGAQLESLIAGVEREQDHLWEAMEAHKAIGDTVTAERISNALSEYTGALSGLWLAEYSLAELSETWSPLERMRMWREFDASLRSAADGLATARDVLGGARPTPTASGFSSPGRLGGGSGAGSGSDDGGSRIERMKRGGIIGALLAALYASYVTMNPWDAPPVEPTDADKKEDPAARHRPVKTIPIKTQNPAPKDEPREEEPVPTENEIIDDLERARDGKPLPPGWKRDGDEIVAPNGERFAVPPREDAPIDRLAPERLRAMTPEELKDLRQRKLDELAGMPEDGSGRRKPIIDDVNAIDAELKRRESDAPRTAERPTDTKEAPDTKAAPDTKTGPRDTTMPGTGTRDPGATRETGGPDAGMPGSTKSGTGAGGLGSFGNVFGLLSQLMKLAGLTLPASTQPQAAQPVNSWVTLTPEKLIAQKGERVKLEWRGTGVQECTVYSKNGPLATGGSQGIVSTPALEQTSIFRLVCTKPGGGVVEVFTSIRIPGTPEPSQSDITSQGFQGVPNATAVRLPPVNNTCNPQDPRMNLRTYLACIGYPYDPRWEPR